MTVPDETMATNGLIQSVHQRRRLVHGHDDPGSPFVTKLDHDGVVRVVNVAGSLRCDYPATKPWFHSAS